MLGRAIPQALRGFFMGAADVVPGVSGGTIALVLGIYAELVATIRALAEAAARLVGGDLGGARAALGRVDWLFIVPLVVGIAAAVLTLARLIGYLLEERPVAISAVFFGLVAASVGVAWGYLRRPAPLHLAVAAGAALVTFLVLGLRSSAVDDPALVVFLGAGALAICAMILPGVSGSFILLMIGLYDAVLAAVNDRELAAVAVFALGCAIGLALFSSVLDRLLRRHHDLVMAALVGLMIGSLRVLWPWPHGTDSTALGAPPADGWLGTVGLAAAGAAAVLIIVRLGARRPEAAPA